MDGKVVLSSKFAMLARGMCDTTSFGSKILLTIDPDIVRPITPCLSNDSTQNKESLSVSHSKVHERLQRPGRGGQERQDRAPEGQGGEPEENAGVNGT